MISSILNKLAISLGLTEKVLESSVSEEEAEKQVCKIFIKCKALF